MTIRDVMKTLSARALLNPVAFARERVRPCGAACASCGAEIRPGRAGRRCAGCREGKTPAQKLVEGVLS